MAEKLKLDAERGRRRQDPGEAAQQAAQVTAGPPYMLLVFLTKPWLFVAQSRRIAYSQSQSLGSLQLHLALHSPAKAFTSDNLSLARGCLRSL